MSTLEYREEFHLDFFEDVSPHSDCLSPFQRMALTHFMPPRPFYTP